jgi:hypothetical protein
MTLERLSGDEAALIDRLREVPAGVARDELVAIFKDLIDCVRDPRCARAQADGVPCDTADRACAECAEATTVLGRLRRKRPV